MRYNLDETVAFEDLITQYVGKYYWRSEAGYTKFPKSDDNEFNEFDDIYDTCIYASESECEADEDGRRAIARIYVRKSGTPNYFKNNSSGKLE